MAKPIKPKRKIETSDSFEPTNNTQENLQQQLVDSESSKTFEHPIQEPLFQKFDKEYRDQVDNFNAYLDQENQKRIGSNMPQFSQEERDAQFAQFQNNFEKNFNQSNNVQNYTVEFVNSVLE
jgi:hypothetical protein